MQLPIELASITEKFAKLPQQKIARASCVFLLGYIAYLAAQMTWVLVPAATEVSFSSGKAGQSSAAQNSQHANKPISLGGIQALNLFGQYSTTRQPVQIEVKDAPKTSLNLTLTGVVASNDSEVAAAIIEHKGNQETYGIGEKITGTNASLDQVLTDRVLIKQSGRTETLMLDGIEYKKQSTTQRQAKPSTVKRTTTGRGFVDKSFVSSPNVVDQRNNRALKTRVRDLKNVLDSEPGKITDFLKISPKRTQGKIVGYSLRPGKDPEFFQQSGLKSGDVALQMNGHDLSMPAEAAQAMQSLKQQLEVSLLVDRNGEMIEILFSIDN